MKKLIFKKTEDNQKLYIVGRNAIRYIKKGEFSMEKYDAHLQFDLPSGYELLRATDEEGKETVCITTGKTTDDEGKVSYEFKMYVADFTDKGPTPLDDAFQDNNEENRISRLSLNGTAENVALTYLVELTFLNWSYRIAKFFLYFRVGKRTYGLLVLQTMAENEQEEKLPIFADQITAVLNSLRIDDNKPGFDPVSDSLFTDTAEEKKKTPSRFSVTFSIDDNKPGFDPVSDSLFTDTEEEEEKTPSRFPVALPKPEQIPHYSFLKKSKDLFGLSGGMIQVNQTGTEYSFVPVSNHAEIEEEEQAAAVLQRAAETKDAFPLSEEAKKMSLLFRVTPEAFNSSEDREQEILYGYLRHVEHFESLRSFIWTLKQYCEANKTEPSRLELDELSDLVAFLKKRKWLNYSENGARGFCDGADIHNYYVSDALSATDKQILKTMTEEEGDVFSLDSVREELSYVYPAVRTLYEDLTYDRDRDQPLVSDEADVLYAWCSAAYAARGPFYTEDGPLNCFYEHPEVESEWMRQALEWTRQWCLHHEEQVKEWNNKYGNMIEKSPRISFSGKRFVFSGLTGREDWPEILEKLAAKGGVFRSAVSGKTDYLVVDPDDLGESKLRAVKEQKVKGHTVTVVSADDFLNAIGIAKEEEKTEEIVSVSREEPKHRPVDQKECEEKEFSKMLKTPELCALDEAEKEKEKRRKEQARKAAEEKKKKEENERIAYNEAAAAWKQATEKAKNDRQTELARLRTEHEQELMNQNNKSLNEALSKAAEAKLKAEKTKADAEKQLASLGVFKLNEKKAQKAIIAEAQAMIEQADADAAAAENRAKEFKITLPEILDKYIKTTVGSVNARFPLPEKPEIVKKFEEAEAAEAKKRKEEKIRERENLISSVLRNMERGKWYNCSEIKKLVPELRSLSGTMETSEICNALVREKKLERTVDHRIVYFRRIW